MISRQAIAALVALVLGGTVACRESTSHAKATGTTLVDLLKRGSFAKQFETREIVFGSGDRDHLVDGWSKDERDTDSDETFVWATSLDAVVSFEVLDVTDLQFLVTLSAFPTPVAQQISVLVNDTEVSSFAAQPIYLEYRFVAPAAILHRGSNRLTFRHTELGMPNPDSSRRFAAAYMSLLIGPNCLPLRATGPPVQPTMQRKRSRKGRPASLTIIGPATLHRKLDVPADAVFRYRISLPPKAHAAATSTVRVKDGEATREIATRLGRSWLWGTSSRVVEVDLSPWSGKTVELEIEVVPDLCSSAVTTAVIDQASILAKEGAKPD